MPARPIRSGSAYGTASIGTEPDVTAEASASIVAAQSRADEASAETSTDAELATERQPSEADFHSSSVSGERASVSDSSGREEARRASARTSARAVASLEGSIEKAPSGPLAGTCATRTTTATGTGVCFAGLTTRALALTSTTDAEPALTCTCTR